jgi:serine/threonine protein phosphatase PrpC
MKIDFASLIGKRKSNEDKHNIIQNIDGRDPSMLNVNFYGIYDGHGGKFVSKFLSEHVYKYFMDKRVKYPLKQKDVTRAYNIFQSKLRTKYPKNAYNTGSTSLIALHYLKNNNEYLNVINLGDCRSVICKNNIAIPLTKDHKPDKPEEECRIRKLGGTIVYDGADWRISDLSVSRAFGDLSAEPYVTCEPDVFEYMITSRDKFIIMACDGLWDVMDNQQAVDFVLKCCYDIKSNNRTKEKINIAKRLADKAIEEGSTDNISVIVVFFR